MKLKKQMLGLLDSNRGIYLSGEEIATMLNVTRTSVWKVVKSLQKEGYEINAVTNKGYCLSEDTDILSSPGIGKYLSVEAGELCIETQKTVDSTNAMIRQKAVSGSAEGFVIIAGEQTNGCGRFGRSFYSPSDTGIYMSVLLRPTLVTDKSTLITTSAAVAVCEAIEKISNKTAQIKWVNDIYIGGKKVCGILTEASMGLESGMLEYVVLGIGVNVYRPDNGFPDEIKDIAGEVFEIRQSDMRNRLAAEILNRFVKYYHVLEQKNFINEYKRRSLAIGRNIMVLSQNGSIPATALGIDDDCRLKVRYADGREEYLHAGEISIKV